MELSTKSDLCIGNLAKSDVSSCYTISTLKARKTYVTGRKRQHLSSASGFVLAPLITWRSLVQIQPPEPSFNPMKLNRFLGFLLAWTGAERSEFFKWLARLYDVKDVETSGFQFFRSRTVPVQSRSRHSWSTIRQSVSALLLLAIASHNVCVLDFQTVIAVHELLQFGAFSNGFP